MSKFDAAVAAEALEYDFTQYVAGARGTIPEPSSQQIQTFTKVLQQILPTQTGEDGKTTVDVEAVSAQVEEGTDVESALFEAIGEFCSNQPSADQIKGLPFRVQRAFMGWLLGAFFSQEG